MKKIPKIEPTRANRPRNAFDLSQKHMFTAPVGMLLPVMSLDLQFHDFVKIQASDFMRTMPMNSSAFISMRSVYEFFFVPYSQMWHAYDQFITGMNDFRNVNLQKLYGGKIPFQVPCVPIKDVYNHVQKDTSLDIFGFKNQYGSARILDMLGYGRPIDFSGKALSVPSAYSGNINLFRLLAYQKIYSDYYRNSTYEQIEVDSFNVDDKKGLFTASSSELKKYLQIRYRNCPNDFFTNLRPSPLFTAGLDASVLNQVKLSSDTDRRFYPDADRYSVFFNLDTNNESGPALLDVSSIRGAFALDKMLQITMRAGKTYAEQVAAHFGVNVSEGRDGQVYYLGGFDSNIQVGDVTQTSGTTNPSVSDIANAKLGGYLGKITGKGTASGSGSISFEAKEPGVLMCIYSLVPDIHYDSQRFDPFVVKQTRGDYFIPEFENLGMQPINPMFISDKETKPYGWQPRYSEYKTAIDINHGQFTNGSPLSFWTVSKVRDSGTLVNLNLTSLKISPRWLDTVFSVNYNGSELTDCMFGYAHFFVQKVSDMSEDGMPRI